MADFVAFLRRSSIPATARAGDYLVLTKPLGIGVASTAIKRGLADARLTANAIRVGPPEGIPLAALGQRSVGSK